MRLLIAALLSATLFTPALAGGWPEMNKQIDQTNFVVNSGCSGTLVDLPNKYVLTAKHCVDAQYETIEREKIDENGIVTKEKVRRLKPGTVKQIFFGGSSEIREVTYRTKLVAVDRDKDLAMLQIVSTIPNTQASKLACKDPSRGDEVFIVGNPTGVFYASIIPGMVSSINRDYNLIGFGAADAESLMQISGGIVGGNSGGAVYDTTGNLVGVPVIGHRTNEVLGFAVPLSAVKVFLKDNKLDNIYSYCASE